MNRDLVDKLARAVLYEGYILYPYRPSVKNHHRWTFGGLYPRAWTEAVNSNDANSMQTEILLQKQPGAHIEIAVRFLHLIDRAVHEVLADGSNTLRHVPSLTVAGRLFSPWQEAAEREASLGEIPIVDLLKAPLHRAFFFPDHREIEMLSDEHGIARGALIRTQAQLDFTLDVSAVALTHDLIRVTLCINNTTAFPAADQSRDRALMASLVSTHSIFGARHARFISLTDPPADLSAHAAGCKNIGAWPVLVGDTKTCDTLLASPIILPDFPELAPESPGDLFDGTEIDEILTLRIMTLTDEEKRQAAAIDPRSKELMARTESLAREQLMNLHGSMRRVPPAADPFLSFDPPQEKLQRIRVGDMDLHIGDQVRLRPLGRADIFDIALDGKLATIASIEQDFEDRIQLAVTVDDDPGKDLGLTGQPGHRFFFGVEEIELLARSSSQV